MLHNNAMIFCLTALPMIVSTFSTPNPREGTQLSIECRVSGIPLPTVVWMKDGNTLNTNNQIFIFFTGSTAKIMILSATVDDAGYYTCIASNIAGNVSEMQRIQIEGKCDQ